MGNRAVARSWREGRSVVQELRHKAKGKGFVL